MGRPKLPLELQKGDLTKEKQAEKQMEQELIKTNSEQLDKAPSWLRDKYAKKEWKRLVDEYKSLSVICNLDYNNLGIYCNSFSNYIEVSKKLDKEDKVVKYTNKAGATNYIENPLIKIQKYYSSEIQKYSSLLGITVDSRLKIASIKSTEIKSDIVNEFGDI